MATKSNFGIATKAPSELGRQDVDPACIVEITERVQFGLQTDGRKDKVKPVCPPQLRCWV